jgi:rhodanese-related sulfurtransferase
LDTHQIAPAELLAQIAAGTPPAILDVRSQSEFRRGHLPGAAHAPFWRVARCARDLALEPADPVVVYCGHGPRAGLAAAVLRRVGFSNIRLLAGHWSKWYAAGLPSVSGPEAG